MVFLAPYLIYSTIAYAMIPKDDSSSSKKILVLLGAPGSGKGTQAKRLSEILNLPHVSTGDLFRNNIKKGTELGLKAKEYIDRGQLTPDELVLDMLYDRVAESDCDLGYILDGFPRRLTQAESLGVRLKSNEKLIAINIKVPDHVIVQRVSDRFVCKKCGAIHHKIIHPPKQKNVCNECGGELYQRSDDKKEVVLERLKVYHKETAPLIHFYEKKHCLHDVNGNHPPDQVFADLLKVATIA